MESEDRLILEIIYILVGLGLFFLAIILIVRMSFVLNNNWRMSLTDTYQTLLAQYVNAPEYTRAEEIKRRIVRISNTNAKKEILLHEVANLYNNFSGRFSDTARDLYQDLELYKLSIKKVKHLRWHNKIEGIVELSLMKHFKAADLIIPLLKHRDINVRRHAKIGLVELKKIEGIKELTHIPADMSEWTFLSILSIMHRTPTKITEGDLHVLKNAESENIRALAAHLEKYSLT
jgi:hypothetical protein